MFEITESNLPQFWNSEEDMARESLRQIEKDFALQGVSISLDFPLKNYDFVVREIAEKFDGLDLVHLARFPAIAYQIDLNESELKLAMARSEPSETYEILAALILKRCFKKVWWRGQMKPNRKEK